jgi:hypothetical protein
MRKLLLLPLLLSLTACVQYYYPETAMEDGVYYAEDDPKYVVFEGGDPGAMYYPWSSLDYFYLGYGYYNPYPIYPYYTGFPFGLLYGWSPWYLPDRYYSHHWYMYGYDYHGRHNAWRPYSGYCANIGQCGRRSGNRSGANQDLLVGNQNDSVPVDDKDMIDGVTRGDNLENLKSARSGNNMSKGRFILTLPPGYANNQGMIIRQNEATNVEKNKVGPAVPSATSRNIIVSATPSVVTVPSSGISNSSTSVPVNRSGASNRQAASSRSRSSGMSAPSRSSRASNRSRSGMSAPRSRPSKSRSSRPVRDLD